MAQYVIHDHRGGVRVIQADSPSAALRVLTDASIKTTDSGLLIAGGYSTVIPASWR